MELLGRSIRRNLKGKGDYFEEFRKLEEQFENIELTPEFRLNEEKTKEKIEHKIDMIMTFTNNQHQIVKVDYPIEILLFKLKILSPSKIKRKSYYSNLLQKKVFYLTIEWDIESMEVMKNLFGHAFQGRYYADSRGVVNFQDKKGGYLIPRADIDKKCHLSYNSLTTELTISFFFEKKKAFLEGDKIVIKNAV